MKRKMANMAALCPALLGVPRYSACRVASRTVSISTSVIAQ